VRVIAAVGMRRVAATAVRATVMLAIALAAACAGRPRPLDDPDRWPSGECRARFTIEHEGSPLAELRELGGWRDDLQDRFPAAAIDPETQRPVTATANLRLEGRPIAWFSPSLDAVVLDGAAFAPLRRADATMPPSTTAPVTASAPQSGIEAASLRQVVGRVTPQARKALGDRGVLEVLLRVEAIQTYWHTGAEVCLTSEQPLDDTYRAELHGVHQWLLTSNASGRTRTLETGFAFAVEIDPGGEVSVVGLAPPSSEPRG
jgi:hypothetical protein